MKQILAILVMLFIFYGLLWGESPMWEPITGAQYNMVLFNTVTVDGENFTNVDENGNMLAAFGPGGEEDCRAVADFFTGPDVWNMTIVSDTTGLEEITFKIYSVLSDMVFDCEESIMFAVDTTVGSLEYPYLLTGTFNINHLPIIDLPEEFSGNEDMEILEDFSDYVIDCDEEDELVLSCEGSEHLTVEITEMLVSISPDANWNGTETLTFTVDDQMSGEAVDNVEIVILPVNDAPILTVPFETFILDEDFAQFEIDLCEHFEDVENDSLTYAIDYDDNEIQISLAEGIVSISSLPNWYGTTTITINVSDNVNRAVTSTYFLIQVMPVNDLPVINLPETFSFEEDSSITDNFAPYISDIDGDSLTLELEENEYITATIAGNIVTISAIANWYGTETITFSVSDNQSRATVSEQTDIVVVSVNDAPALISPLEDIEVVEDYIPYMINLGAYFVDIDTDTLEFSYTNSQPELTVILANGIMTISSSENWSGYGTIMVTANDGEYEISDSFVYTVTPVNDGPVINDYSPVSASFTVFREEMVDFSIEAYDPDSDLTYQWYSNEVLLVENSSNLSYTFDDVSATEIYVTVSDEEFSLTQNWSVEVYLNENWMPVVYTNSTIAYGSVMINNQQAGVEDIVGAFVDDQCRGVGNIFILQDIAYVSMNIQGEIIEEVEFRIWDASDNWIFDDVYSVLSNPGGDIGSPEEPLPIHFVANQYPEIDLPDGGFVFNEDTQLTIDFIQYVSDPDLDSLYITYSGNQNVIVQVTNGLLVTLSAASNWNGIENVEFIVNDGFDGIDSEIIPINVIPVNDNPLLIMPLADLELLEDADPIVTDLSLHFYDIDADSLSYTASYANTQVELSIQNGIMTLAPIPDWNGVTQITVTANDAVMNISDTFTLTVIGVNDPPYINVQIPDPYIVDEDFESITLDLDNYYADVDGDDLSYEVDFDETNIQIDLTGSIVTISPIANWFGETTISLTISDDQGRAQIEDSFLLIVNSVNDTPTLDLPDEVSFNEDGSLAFDISEYAYDVEGDELICTISGNTNIIANIFGMTIIFTATPNWNGSEIVSIMVNDLQAREIFREEMTVTVNPVNDPPVIISFTPVETEIDTLQHSTVDFHVEVTDIDSEPVYSWRVNNQPVVGDLPDFSYLFDEDGTFVVRCIITDGNYSYNVTWIVHVEETDNNGEEIIPSVTAITGNYPNPFNPETTIEFTVSSDQHISIDVYNSRGQHVKTLVKKVYQTGIYKVNWDGKDDRSRLQPSGIYYFRMISDSGNDINKALLLK
ncbi:MAG: tandem-95 repeat protein [Candidatus Stygibacter frigidus]|nr:tandem-95 repeat protein [Candidatus Stygibacter frigidus]